MLDFSDKIAREPISYQGFTPKPYYDTTKVSKLSSSEAENIQCLNDLVQRLREAGVAASFIKGDSLTKILSSQEVTDVHVVVDMNMDEVLLSRLNAYDNIQGYKYGQFPHGKDYYYEFYGKAFDERCREIVEVLPSLSSPLFVKHDAPYGWGESIVNYINYRDGDLLVTLDFGVSQYMTHRYASQFRENESSTDPTNPYLEGRWTRSNEDHIALSPDGETLIHSLEYFKFLKSLKSKIKTSQKTKNTAVDLKGEATAVQAFTDAMIGVGLSERVIQQVLKSVKNGKRFGIQ